jgi:hypothetical protein
LFFLLARQCFRAPHQSRLETTPILAHREGASGSLKWPRQAKVDLRALRRRS